MGASCCKELPRSFSTEKRSLSWPCSSSWQPYGSLMTLQLFIGGPIAPHGAGSPAFLFTRFAPIPWQQSQGAAEPTHQASTLPTSATLVLQALPWVPDPHVWVMYGGGTASPSSRAEHKGSTVSCELLALGQAAIALFCSLSLKLWVAPGCSVLLFLSGNC